jgi:radical SAM superfamily enzyme YgiQ (UPF0313 family)
MDDALFKKIINECSSHRGIERIILYLNNEPLTDINIVERINYTKNTVPWASVHILTNGSLLDEKMQDGLIDSKLDWIGISMHGIKKQSVESAMGLDYGTVFPRVLNFIQKARKKRDPNNFVMITFLKHKYMSVEESNEAISFWKNQGVSRVSFFEAPISRAGNVSSMAQTRHPRIFGCSTIWANEMIHIVENADVVLCCMDWRREIILGNVNNQSIYEIWNSEKYAQIRDKRDGNKNSEDNFICKRCEAAIVSKENKPLQVALDKNRDLDILLVMCPMWGLNIPPLGVSYLHAYLKKAGYSSLVLDINVDLFNKAANEHKDLWQMQNFRSWNDRHLFEDKVFSLFGKEIDSYVNKIMAQNVKIIGFSVNAGNLLFSIELAKRLKERDQSKIIIFGGPHSKWFKTDINYLEQNHLEQYKDWYWGFYLGLVDIFVIGEGEAVLLEILRRFKNNIELDQIPGTILYRNKYLCFEGENFTQDLNTLPFPDFSWANLNAYTEKKLPILLSRGCIRKCSFCNDTFVSAKYRCRSAENVFEEIKLRLVNNKISNFDFLDLIINGNLIELEKLCDLIIREKINLHWSAQGGIRKDMSLGLLCKMKKAGCDGLTYGTESFSDKVLQLMRKPYTYEDIKKVLRNTAEAGIRVSTNIVTGFPGEGEKEFKESIERLEKCSGYINGISSLAPCLVNLGSDLHLNAKEYGIIYPEKDYYFNWYTNDGNNYPLRKRRAKEFLLLASKLKLSVQVVNLYDEQSDEQINQKEVNVSKPIAKTDILLVIPPPWGVETPPLGLACLSTYLRSKGFNTEVLDLNIYLYNRIDEKHKYLWEIGNAPYWRDRDAFDRILYPLIIEGLRYCVDKIISSDVKTVGLSVLSVSQNLITAEIIKQIKRCKPDIKIILGGISVSVDKQREFFEQNLINMVDSYVIGEGEETLANILDAYRKGLKIEEIPGALIHCNGKRLYTPGKLEENLDKFPYPSFEEFNLDSYANKNKGLIMEWSRGYIGNCSFYAFKAISGKFRNKSASAVLEALDYYKKKYAVEHFSLVDSAVNRDLRRLEEICQALISSKLDLKFSALAIPRKGMNVVIIEKMKVAGFQRLEYGIESGSNKVLKLMNKTFTVEDTETVISLTHKAGIVTVIYLITGFPGEGEEEFNQTLGFLKRNAQYIDLVKSVNPLYLMVGSNLYKNYRECGITLPLENPDFKWYIDENNNYQIRLDKVHKIRQVLKGLGVKYFSEDNQFEKQIEEKYPLQQEELFQQHILKKKRSISRWFLLIFSVGVVFIYIVYFWFLMFLRNRIILGGRKE